MRNSKTEPASLLIDMKKYRLRIHKATLHQMDDPNYIQLLVNPARMVMAIRSLTTETSGDQSHRVPHSAMEPYSSVEIYSRPFVSKLHEVSSILNSGGSYRLSGNIFPEEKIAVFSLQNPERIDEEEHYERAKVCTKPNH